MNMDDMKRWGARGALALIGLMFVVLLSAVALNLAGVTSREGNGGPFSLLFERQERLVQVSVDDIFRNPVGFLGGRAKVTGTVARVVGPGRYLLTDTGRNHEILVVHTAGKSPPTPVPGESVTVTGEVRQVRPGGLVIAAEAAAAE